MTWDAVLLLAGVFALAAAVPGPCMIAISARAARDGFVRGMVMALGVGVGDMCFLTLAALGLGWVAREMAPVFMLVRWAGACYLFWLGWKALAARDASGGETACAAPARRSLLADWLGGLCTCLSNPKVILFYGSVLPTFLDMSALRTIGLLEAAAVIWVVLMCVCTSYALAAAYLGRRLSSGGGRLLRRATGLAFIGCGVAVARQ